jgi:phage portal protein BeeE
MSFADRLKGAAKALWGSPSPAAAATDPSAYSAPQGMMWPAYTNQWLGGPADWARNVVSPALWGTLPGATRDFALEAQQPWLNATTSICLDWIVDRFNEATLYVESKTAKASDAEPIEGHPLPEFLRKPNDGYQQSVLFAATVLSLALEGNAYWYKEKSIAGVIALWWLPHWSVRPRWNLSGTSFIDFYEYQVAGKFRPLDKGDVVHFRSGLDPDNQRLGRSRLKALLRTIVADNGGETWDAAIMKNMGATPFVFVPRDATRKIVQDDATAAINLYQANHTGDNNGKPGFLLQPMDLIRLGLSPAESNMNVIRNALQARIAAALGMSCMAVGLPDDSRTYDNYATAIKAAFTGAVDPLHTLIALTLSEDADFLDVKSERVAWDFSRIPARQEDATAKAERTTSLWTQDLMTHGEARKTLALPVVPKLERLFYSDLAALKAPPEPRNDQAQADA